MDSVLDIIDDAMDRFERALNELPRVSASEIGLDVRAGFVYVDIDEQLIIVDHNSVRSLDYYGGFEYVDEDAITVIGDFKVYQSDDGDDRVGGCIEYFERHSED